MALTKIAPNIIAVANNVTNKTVGNTTSIPSFTFDGSGVVTSASNVAISGAGITSNTITGDKITVGSLAGNVFTANTITGDKLGQSAISSNNIVSVNASVATVGTLPTARLPAGSIIQIQNTILTNGTFSSTSTSLTNITGLGVTITPTSASNKILIKIAITYAQQSNYNVGYLILRNGSAVGIGTSGTTGPNLSFCSSPAGTNTPSNCNWTYLDSPATTSAVTYQIQMRQQSGGAGTFCLNFASGYLNAGSDVYQGCFTSSITAMEVVA